MATKTKKRYEFEPDFAVPPGATLQETIDALGMTQRDLAKRTGMAHKTINEIIKGKAPITPDTSIRLERVTGVPARMWSNLEANYREHLARVADRDRLQDDLDWLKSIPTRELIKRNAIEASGDKLTLLQAVLKFFGVASVAEWKKIWERPEAAFRKSNKFCAEPGALATWLRLGELEAQQIKTKPYDKAQFHKCLQGIRALTTQATEDFQSKMVELCLVAGVALVFVPEIKRCPTSGAARWLEPNKALIQLSLRYKRNDQFWFSFFHEAGHVLDGPKKEIFIDDDSDESEREEHANRFAANFLIPPERLADMRALKSKAAVRAFAADIGIAPGIVVGRLQKERIIPYSHLNDLKLSLTWIEG